MKKRTSGLSPLALVLACVSIAAFAGPVCGDGEGIGNDCMVAVESHAPAQTVPSSCAAGYTSCSNGSNCTGTGTKILKDCKQMTVPSYCQTFMGGTYNAQTGRCEGGTEVSNRTGSNISIADGAICNFL